MKALTDRKKDKGIRMAESATVRGEPAVGPRIGWGMGRPNDENGGDL